jgi:hypothetical protein
MMELVITHPGGATLRRAQGSHAAVLWTAHKGENAAKAGLGAAAQEASETAAPLDSGLRPALLTLSTVRAGRCCWKRAPSAAWRGGTVPEFAGRRRLGRVTAAPAPAPAEMYQLSACPLPACSAPHMPSCAAVTGLHHAPRSTARSGTLPLPGIGPACWRPLRLWPASAACCGYRVPCARLQSLRSRTASHATPVALQLQRQFWRLTTPVPGPIASPR